jgi:predicted RNase H-like nuclease (RuvC/YqgF family)
MKSAECMSKSMHTLLIENDALCRQLAKLQERASELIQKRSAEVEQLTTVVAYLSAELHDREAMIVFLRTKLQEFRKIAELQ